MLTNKNKGNNISFCIMCIICVCLILAVGFFSICYCEFPSTTTDELAYLSQAARYAGLNAKDLMSYYAFYGQGISILWAVLFPIFKYNPIHIYKAIIILNCIFIIISLFISMKCGKILFPQTDKLKRMFSALVVLVYPCNFYNMQLATPECLLWLLFWCCFLCINLYLESRKSRYVIALSFFMSVMLIVHFRTIVFAGITILFWGGLLCIKKTKIKDLIILAGIFLLGYGGFQILKHGHYEYVEVVNSITQGNIDFNYFELLKVILGNIRSYLETILYELSYFILVGSIPFIFIFKRLYGIVKLKNVYKKNELISISYLLILFMANLCAFSMGQVTGPARYDSVVYARYVEYLIGPIIYLGINYAINENEKIGGLKILIISAVTEGIVIRIYLKMLTAENRIFAVDSAVGLGGFIGYWSKEEDVLKGLLLAYISLILILIIYNYCIDKNRQKQVWLLALLTIFWGSTGIKANIYNWENREILRTEYYEVRDELEGVDNTLIVYIRDEEVMPLCIEGKYVQWAILDKGSIAVMNRQDIEDNIDKNFTYITSHQVEIPNISREVSFENRRIRIYK